MNYKILFLFVSIFTGATAQKMGFIEYDIEIHGITPEINKGAAMMVDSKMSLFFSDSAIRQEYALGTHTKKTTILNYQQNQGIFYEDGENGKYGVFGTCSQINQLIQVDTTSRVEFTDHQKKILTYSCKKALMHLQSGEVVEYWYTTDFPIETPSFGLFNPKIPGIILEFSSTANGFFMRFKCSNYGNELEDPDKLFEPKITRDYKMIEFNSYVYYMQMQQQHQPK